MIKGLKVKEIYRTILGESSRSGTPCVIIRLSGCNLRCSWCDTKYAYSGGRNLKLTDITKRVSASGLKTVLITGGEPLIQKNIYSLINRLINRKFKIIIETNGSFDISGINPKGTIILDLKTPSSGMSDRNLYANLKKIRKRDEIKFVICDKKDYNWSKEVIRKYKLLKKCTVLISPVFNKLNYNKLAKWILRDNLDVRLNLQIHKIIGIK